jgi:plasmid replication initiation protein
MIIMSELTEKTNELVENQSVTDLIDKQRNILAKSKILKLSNLANRMTPIQNAIFSLALRNVVIDGDRAITEVQVSELLELIKSSEYSKFNRTAINRDKKAIQENHINLIDEKFYDNDPNGKSISIGLFSYFEYERGKFIGVFNSTPDRKGKTPILDILKSQEVNPLMYNLNTFSKLSPSGQMLYEELLIFSGQNIRSAKYDIEGLKQLFKSNGKSMNRYYTINQKHLKGAIEDINKYTDMDLVVKPVKEGRAVTGIELVWSIDKIKLQATEDQRKTLHELYVQLKKLEPTSKEDLSLLYRLENPHLVSKQEAQGLISIAIGRVRSLAIEQQPALPSVPERKVVADVEKVKELFPSVEKRQLNLVATTMQDFPEEEQDAILEYALFLGKHNNARSVKYILHLLNGWFIEGIKTKAQAVALHDQNYGEPLPDVSKIEISDEFRNAMDLWKD